MNLIEHIENSGWYAKEFDKWEATEQIIDDNKAFWCLRKPGSEYEKVCLYRDNYTMVVYGDYGTMTFDQMTWKGSVYNLHYDNIGYQMEKLNHESKKTLYTYDESACEEDIIDWLKQTLSDRDIEEELIDRITEYFNESDFVDTYDIEQYCEMNECDELVGLLDFVNDCSHHTGEYEWIAFLRSTDFSKYDEECESELWNAGKRIDQRYFINMYALRVCGEKLKKLKEVSNGK
ncbi:hypothetical protein LXJ15735_27620 [Lacrimispora xylanolytica]